MINLDINGLLSGLFETTDAFRGRGIGIKAVSPTTAGTADFKRKAARLKSDVGDKAACTTPKATSKVCCVSTSGVSVILKSIVSAERLVRVGAIIGVNSLPPRSISNLSDSVMHLPSWLVSQ